VGFDELDFFFVQAVFLVELTVDVSDALGPVDVGMRGEILNGYASKNGSRVVLSYFFYAYQCSEEFGFYVLQAIRRFKFVRKAANG